MSEGIKGEVGFKEDEKKEEILNKEEAMFKVDTDGKAIPEKYLIYIYDRKLDIELIEESQMLMLTLKKHKSINKLMAELKQEQEKELKGLLNSIEKEIDDKVKQNLQQELITKQNTKMSESVQERINANIVDESVKESREILKELNKEKNKQKVKKYVELKPCNSAESVFAFEKHKTIEGKQTDYWVEDLISKKIVDPLFSFEDAKNLKEEFKFALRDAIMEASGYKLKSYKDLITEKKLEEEKPLLTKKKEMPS